MSQRFFQLKSVEYDTDEQYTYNNPVQLVCDWHIPGIICQKCGEIWAGSRFLFCHIPEEIAWVDLTSGPIPDTLWFEFVRRYERLLQAQSGQSIKFEPGDAVGFPIAKIVAPKVPDIIFPETGPPIVVTDVVADALRTLNASGFRLEPLYAYWDPFQSSREGDVVGLNVLHVTGSAWRPGNDKDNITTCDSCSRVSFDDPEWLVVDIGRWDGSDFFLLDENPNLIFVTERICSLFSESNFLNYNCILVPAQ